MSNRSPKDGMPLDADALRSRVVAALAAAASRGVGGAPPPESSAPSAQQESVEESVEESVVESVVGSVEESFVGSVEEQARTAALAVLLRDVSANEAMVAYCGAQLACLRVSSGREALCLLLSSERVFVDMLQVRPPAGPSPVAAAG
jgi:hypothetical protein